MNLSNKKVLVTGADGFIGSHLTEELVRRGAAVRAFVCYNSSSSWGNLEHCDEEIKKSIEVIPGDVRDPHAVLEAAHGVDAIFHLAALIAIPFSFKSPASYVETNISGTLNVLQAAREAGVERMVHTSTSEVYGTAKFVPITEEHPLNGQSPYAASKIGGDQMALSFFHSFSVPVSIVRPFNTYGPRQSARAIIPSVISQIASGQKKIKMGSTHPTRDFNFVLDTVAGFIAAAESEKSVGEVINIGSNFEVSIAEVVEIIQEVMQSNVEIETDQNRIRPGKSEVERLWADNSKAKRLLDWTPQYGGTDGLRRGLKKTADWITRADIAAAFKPTVYNI